MVVQRIGQVAPQLEPQPPMRPAVVVAVAMTKARPAVARRVGTAKTKAVEAPGSVRPVPQAGMPPAARIVALVEAVVEACWSMVCITGAAGAVAVRPKRLVVPLGAAVRANRACWC